MDIMIWTGAAISAIGLIGIVYCMRQALKAKGEGLDDDAMRERLQKLVGINMGALFLSMLGLIVVVVGIILSNG